jgi:hypothetical protein
LDILKEKEASATGVANQTIQPVFDAATDPDDLPPTTTNLCGYLLTTTLKLFKVYKKYNFHLVAFTYYICDDQQQELFKITFFINPLGKLQIYNGDQERLGNPMVYRTFPEDGQSIIGACNVCYRSEYEQGKVS